ncbi:hypothetical protein KC354_g13891 [Hortaea werneckii]|nr:hypothetical protein KC354_g13891 [Hortaea werneckii]
MAPNRPVNFSQLLWKEALPVGGFVGSLAWIHNELKYSQWFSPVGNIYVWTAIWFTLSLVSLHCLYRHGSFYVAAFGWMQNLWMLWDLYKEATGTEASLQLENVVYAGVFTVVAVGLNSYILANRVRMDYSPALPTEDESREAEKA